MVGGTLVFDYWRFGRTNGISTARVLILLPLYPILQSVIIPIGHFDSFFSSILRFGLQRRDMEKKYSIPFHSY